MASSQYDGRLSGPLTAQLVAMSGAGKTSFMKQFLKHHEQLVNPPFTKKIWVYAEWQVAYDDMDDVEFVRTLNEDTISREKLGEGSHTALVIDDMIDEIDEKFMSRLYSKYSHHRFISCFTLLQSLFLTSMRNHRFLSQNTHYLFLWKSPRDYCSVTTLLRQMFGSKSYKYALDAFEDATRPKYGYLLISMCSDTPRELSLRSRILPHEENYVYLIP